MIKRNKRKNRKKENKDKLAFQDNRKKCLSRARKRGWRFSKKFSVLRLRQKNFLKIRPAP